MLLGDIVHVVSDELICHDTQRYEIPVTSYHVCVVSLPGLFVWVVHGNSFHLHVSVQGLNHERF